MRRIVVVANPTAGRGRGRIAGDHVIESLRRDGYAVADASGPTLALALESTRAAVTEGTDALVVVGGDGMVHLGVNVVAKTRIPLAIAAVGTGNDFAAGLGLPVGGVDECVAALRTALARPPSPIDVAIVETRDRTLYAAGILSAGIDAAVNAHANSLRRPRGRSRYTVAALLELATFRSYGYAVRLDGVDGPAPERVAGVETTRSGDGFEWRSPGALVAVANGPRIGGGILVAPDARLDDGLFDIVLAGPHSRTGALRLFPGMYAGKHVTAPGVGVVRAQRVHIEATDEGATPPPAFADGEFVGHLPVTVRMAAGGLLIHRPT